MKIIFFFPKGIISIRRSFEPLINRLRESENIEVYEVPYSGATPYNVIRNIIYIRKHSSADAINHIAGDIHYGVFGLVGKKSVLTIHDDYAIVKANRGWLHRMYKLVFWMKIPVKLASRTLCISRATYDKISSYVDNRKVEVLSNHVIDSRFKFSPKAIDSKCIRILQLGATEQKNLETTIKVVSKLPYSCHLRVIKKMTQKQHELAKELNVSYSNVFNISDEQIVKEYEQSDIVVFPSLYEGFGMPVMEAQTVGRALITSNIAPMKDVAGGSECAVLLDNPKDENEYLSKLLLLIDDEQIREHYISNGRVNALHYSVDEVSSKYNEFYKQLYYE